MIVVNRSSALTSFELVHGQEGVAQAYVTAINRCPHGGLYKVWYGPTGFLMGPLDTPVSEYLIAYLPRGEPAGFQGLIRVGGLTPSFLIYPGLSVGQWLQVGSGGTIAANEGEYPSMRDFGCVHSVDDDDNCKVWLLPRTARDIL